VDPDNDESTTKGAATTRKFAAKEQSTGRQEERKWEKGCRGTGEQRNREGEYQEKQGNVIGGRSEKEDVPTREGEGEKQEREERGRERGDKDKQGQEGKDTRSAREAGREGSPEEGEEEDQRKREREEQRQRVKQRRRKAAEAAATAAATRAAAGTSTSTRDSRWRPWGSWRPRERRGGGRRRRMPSRS